MNFVNVTFKTTDTPEVVGVDTVSFGVSVGVSFIAGVVAGTVAKQESSSQGNVKNESLCAKDYCEIAFGLLEALSKFCTHWYPFIFLKYLVLMLVE